MNRKPFLVALAELIAAYRPHLNLERPRWLRGWLPSRGNVVFTLIIAGLLVLAQTVGALPLGRPQGIAPTATSTSTIAYQGRLADSAGAPLTGTYNMIFRLYDAAAGGTPLWEEQWIGSNGVKVSDGLFNVMLGSLSPISSSLVASHSSLFLGITVGTDDEMAPRVQLGSVPFAVQALTVPDGSVTTAKIADGAVTQVKLGADVSLTPPDGSITTAKIVDGAVTTAKLNIDAGISMNGDLTTSGMIGLGAASPVAALHISRGGITGSSIRLVNTMSGGGQWNLYTGDNGCFGDSLGIGPIVPVGSGQCGGDQGSVMALRRDGSVWVLGSFSAGGTKSAVVQTNGYGQRKLYAIEAPEVRFSDEGMARLQGGMARVELDPIFLETIEGEYLVHVTPYGDASLYVAEVGQDYFVVKAWEGDPNAAFAWQLSATRKGYAGVRLEEVGLDHEAAKNGLISNDKRELSSFVAGGYGVADLDLMVVHDDAVDEQFHQLSALCKGKLRQRGLDALAEGFDAGG